MTKEKPLSPSTINLFINDPALWVLKHYYGLRGSLSIYPIRGIIVEDIINDRMDKMKEKDAIEKAMDKLYEMTFDLDTLNVVEYEQIIIDFYKTAFPILINIGLCKKQVKVEGEIEGVPLIGYLDYVYDNEYDNYFIDLKTTTKVPHILTRGPRKGYLPANKKDNIRQQAIYNHLTGKAAKLLYCDGEGNELLYELQEDDYKDSMKEVRKVVKKIKKYLTMDLKDVINDIEPKNTNGFYWDDKLREKAKELWDEN